VTGLEELVAPCRSFCRSWPASAMIVSTMTIDL
jgi:hypothetical protein